MNPNLTLSCSIITSSPSVHNKAAASSGADIRTPASRTVCNHRYYEARSGISLAFLRIIQRFVIYCGTLDWNRHIASIDFPLGFMVVSCRWRRVRAFMSMDSLEHCVWNVMKFQSAFHFSLLCNKLYVVIMTNKCYNDQQRNHWPAQHLRTKIICNSKDHYTFFSMNKRMNEWIIYILW